MVKTKDLNYLSTGIALVGEHVYVTLQNVWRLI